MCQKVSVCTSENPTSWELMNQQTETCGEMYTCCDCGGNDCGCRYCWSCNACDECLED